MIILVVNDIACTELTSFGFNMIVCEFSHRHLATPFLYFSFCFLQAFKITPPPPPHTHTSTDNRLKLLFILFPCHLS